MNHLNWQTINNYKDAPSTCGVYQYWAGDKLLYIGKAVNLKARLASHAQNAKLDEKERAIVGGATEIRYTEVDSEFLALLLEASLIREHMPPYNRIWKDDKTYLYIVIDLNDPFPRPHFARAHELKNSHIKIGGNLRTFGPFPNTNIAEEVLRAIRRLIPFCMVKKVGKHKCFYSKIGLCDPCPASILKTNDQVLKKQYRKQIFQVIKILSGKVDPVIKDLTHDLVAASDRQDYETALKLRTKIERFTRFISHHTFRENSTITYNTANEKINALQSLLTDSLINGYTNIRRIECYDASNSSMHDSVVSMVVSVGGLIDRGEYRRFKIKNPRVNNDFDRLAEVLERRLKNKTWDRPDLIVIDGGAPQLRRLLPIFDRLETPILYLGLAKHPDHLVIPKSTGEYSNVQPDHHNLGFRHLQELRDEAHRFANSYRRVLQSKRIGLANN